MKEIEKLAEEAYPIPKGTLTLKGVVQLEREAFIAGYQKSMGAQNLPNEILRLDNAWPLIDVLRKLTEASDILLHQRDYDKTGWEEHEYAYREGLKIIEQLNRPMQPLEAQKQPAMSLEEVKDEVAKRYGFYNWKEIDSENGHRVLNQEEFNKCYDEVAELYANQFREDHKWVECKDILDWIELILKIGSHSPHYLTKK